MTEIAAKNQGATSLVPRTQSRSNRALSLISDYDETIAVELKPARILRWK